MSVACVEAEGDGPAGLVEGDVLGPDRPLAGERPVVEAQALREGVGATVVHRWTLRRRELAAAPVAEISLRRAQVLPVGRRLHAQTFDRDGLALDAQQLLDDALRLLVAAFAEVLVADDAVGVGEVQ